MTAKKAAVLFTGGKDSCLALHKAIEDYEIIYLLSILPENADSFMFHKPYLNFLKQQAKMLGKELVTFKSKGEEEKEVGDLKRLIEKVKDDIEVVVVGGIASNYQGERVKNVCGELGLDFYAPLWDYAPEDIWKELFDNDFKVILTKISCEGISKDFLGKVIDKKMFVRLQRLSEDFKFRIDFEGGEAESAVLWMPGFKSEINIDFKIKSEGKYRHFIDNIKIK